MTSSVIGVSFMVKRVVSRRVFKKLKISWGV